MENRNIIVVLVVIIVILAAVIGFMVLKPMHAKEPTKLKITSNDTLYEGKDLTLKLTDLNKTPLSNQNVDITIKNSKGKVIANKTVKTNDKGNAKMDLNLKKGKYAVLVAYGGNENYTGNNTTQKLTIKEEEILTQTEESYGQNNQKLEFNGKTHEQNVQDAKNSRDKGGQWAGASDEQIEKAISKIEKDGGMI